MRYDEGLVIRFPQLCTRGHDFQLRKLRLTLATGNTCTPTHTLTLTNPQLRSRAEEENLLRLEFASMQRMQEMEAEREREASARALRSELTAREKQDALDDRILAEAVRSCCYLFVVFVVRVFVESTHTTKSRSHTLRHYLTNAFRHSHSVHPHRTPSHHHTSGHLRMKSGASASDSHGSDVRRCLPPPRRRDLRGNLMKSTVSLSWRRSSSSTKSCESGEWSTVRFGMCLFCVFLRVACVFDLGARCCVRCVLGRLHRGTHAAWSLLLTPAL